MIEILNCLLFITTHFESDRRVYMHCLQTEFEKTFHNQIQIFDLYISAKKVHFFNSVLIRFVGQIKITLLLKIPWKQHHISYVKIVYKQNMMCKKVLAQLGRVLIKGRSIKADEMCVSSLVKSFNDIQSNSVITNSVVNEYPVTTNEFYG